MTVTNRLQSHTMSSLPRDATAFDAVFAEYWPQIHALLVRVLGDPAEAEDLAIEVFLKLHGKPKLLNGKHNIGGWLYKVAINLGYNALRAGDRRTWYETKAGKRALLETPPPDPIEETQRIEERRQVRTVLASMKPKMGKILLLRYSGLKYHEIAPVLGVSPASVGKLLSRAENEFEKRYTKMFGGG